MKKRILVTGGAGFIGSNFCNLLSEHYDLTALDSLYLGDPANLTPATHFVKGDCTQPSDLAQCGDQFDAIVHLAGTSSAPMFNGDNFAWAYQNAISSFCQVLEFARRCGAQRVLYASTSSLYGNNPIPLLESQAVRPPNHYSVTKFCYELCAECYHRVYPQLDIIGFRFMSIYGPNEEAKGQYANMISQFVWDIARGLPPVIYGDGDQFRDFTNVRDIIQALQLSIEHPTPLGTPVFNIGRGQSTSFNDIFTVIQQQLQSDITPIYIPNPVKEGYVKGQHADISLISQTLGYAPTVELTDGIAQIIDTLDLGRIKETSSDLIRHQYQ